MRHHHPQYVDLPVLVRAYEPKRSGRRGGHRIWLLMIGLILLAIFLIGVNVTGGVG